MDLIFFPPVKIKSPNGGDCDFLRNFDQTVNEWKDCDGIVWT